MHIKERSQPLCFGQHKTTLFITNTRAKSNSIQRMRKGNIYVTFIPVRAWFSPMRHTLNIRLSGSIIAYGLGIHPVSEEGTYPFTNRLSSINNIIPDLVVPMLPNTSEGHTKDLLLSLIKML